MKGFKFVTEALKIQKGINSIAIRDANRKVVGTAITDLSILPQGFTLLDSREAGESVGMRSLRRHGTRAVVDRATNELVGVLHIANHVPMKFLDRETGTTIPVVKLSEFLRSDEKEEIADDEIRLRHRVTIHFPPGW